MLVNYYKILGISINASQNEVRKAYREKAKCYHPDVNDNMNANGDFQLINEAYQVLNNTNKRLIYDLRLKNGSHNYSNQRVYYRPGNVHYKPRTRSYRQSEKDLHESSTDKFEKYFDLFLFLTLTFAGAYAFLYGIYRLLIRPVEEINPYPGIILGIIFTSLMIILWNKKIRMLG
jgi:curved DNA-binding protein CbpA